MWRFRAPALLILAATPLAAADVSGAWQIVGSAMGFPVNVICSIKQQDSKLSGNCLAIKTRIDAKMTGEIEGDKLSFHYDFAFEGSPMRMAYEGRLEGESTIRGAMDVISSPLAAPQGTRGTFVAYKGKAATDGSHKVAPHQ